jgi:hypothetical protein
MLAFQSILCLSIAQTMRRNRIHLGFGRTAKAVTGVLAIVLVLLLGAFAVSPSLHQRLHTDSANPDHFCAVSAFATGQLTWTAPNLAVAIACAIMVCGSLLRETPWASHLNLYFSPNRAPPRL